MKTARHAGASIALAATVFLLVCAVPLTASAITSTQVIRRAKVWTATKVPYSQSRYYTEQGVRVTTTTVDPRTLGYRTDCSGYVSMALSLRTKAGTPLSLDTASLPLRMRRISKSQLAKGDIVMRPKNAIVDGKQVPYGHAVIFKGWTSSSRSHYWGMHESSSARGAVLSKIPWGRSGFYTAKGFGAYRYPAMRSRERIERKF